MAAVIHRPLRGSRISTFYPVKNLPSLASLDSAFQLQEYISLLIRLDVHDVNAIVSLPGNPSAKDKEKEMDVNSEKKGKESEKDVDVDKGKGEPTVDEACWIYEQLRRLAQDLSHPLITTLQQECTRASCPEMKAGEWLYLCVAHGNDGAMEHCCAIDYILHTVDSATALLNSPRTFPSRLQIPVASHRHFSSLARRLGRIFAHAYFHHREAFEQAEAESSLYARFLALTERFDLVPAEFLVIPLDGSNSGSIGEPLGLGHPPSRSARDDHRRPNEFDRGYHQQQQQQQQHQRTRYDLDLVKFHHGSEPSAQHQLHSNILERNSSPLRPSSSDSSLGGIGESPASLSAKARFGRHRTGTMVFAEAEATAVTDELAVRSSLREREREPQKIELLERVIDPRTLKMDIPTVSQEEEEEEEEEEEIQFEVSLSPGEVVGNSGEGGNIFAPEVFEESPGRAEKHELSSLLGLDLESRAPWNTVETALPPSAPAEPETNVSAESSSHPSVEREVTPAYIVADQPKEEAASVKSATSTQVKFDDSLETKSIPMETTADIPPENDNVLVPVSTSVPKETPETAIVSISNQEVATKPDAADDKGTVSPFVINGDDSPTAVPAVPVVPVVVDAITVEAPILVKPEVETKPELEEPTKIAPTIEAFLDKVPAKKTQPEVVVNADKPVVEPSPDVDNAATKEDKGKEKSSVADSTTEEGKIGTGTEEDKKT